MKINNIKVNYGRTINLGNYESCRLDIELSATLEPKDDPEMVADELRAQAKLQINRWIKYEQNGSNNKSLDDDIPY